MKAEGSASRPADVPRPAAQWAALAGLVGGGLALGVAELLAGPLDRVPSPVLAVGDVVIDNSPRWLVEFGIGTFGTADKQALTVGVVVASMAMAALLGIGAARRPVVGRIGFGGFAVLGVLAAARSPETSLALAVFAAFAAAAAGSLATGLLLTRAPSAAEVALPSVGSGVSIRSGGSRRAFLGLAGAFVAVAMASAAIGRSVSGMSRAAAARARLVLPRPARPLPARAPGNEPDVAGLSPFFTPNSRFYRIDEALVVPDIDPDDWRLRVSGLVEHPFELTYDELLDLPLVEADVTLACVSNIVGGDLIGNARWLGVPLVDLLERAGVRSEATQVVGRSADRFTVGFPTAAVLDGRSALVAIGMNGEPLPVEHGFPARLVVAGLYGYVSATKWLTEIELSTFDAFDAYWIRQGWAREGPIKTHARIDVPRPYAEIPTGTTTIAGVAWAPTRGIRTVEVQVDDRPWRTTTLAAASSDETWRQWSIEWDAAPGAHLIRVRATDGSGGRQTATARGPFPDGATGLHTVAVRIAG